MKAIISRLCRIRHPGYFKVGPDSVIDDFSYFSARITIGRGCHIASGCSVAGGKTFHFRMGDLSSLSSGVKVWCASNNFRDSLIALSPSKELAQEMVEVRGNVTMENYTGVGANSVVLPDNHLPEGVAIGALSLVPSRFAFEAWTLYAGVPIRKIRMRDRKKILQQVEKVRKNWVKR